MSEKQNREVELIQTDSTTDNTQQSFYALQLGEYFLHLYLQETTSLALQDESDVVVKITAFGETQVSKIQKSVGLGSQTFWGQHFFFRKVFNNRSELERSEFTIEVLDHHSLLRDKIIGQTGGSMLQIHSQPKNSVLNKWAILTNAKEDYRKAMGFLKYSINFCQASDPQTNLETQSMSGKQQNKIDIPPNVQLKKKQIMIKVYRGERVVKMDDNGKADPYVKFYFGNIEIKTRKIKESLNPVFNQKLYLPCVYPTITQNLKMSFKDYDRFGKNDFIGSLYFKLTDIERGIYKNAQWNYFYGAPKNAKDEKIEKKMNEFPEISSSFKGALLVSVEMQDVDEPEFMIEEFEEGEDDVSEHLQLQTFTVRMDLEYIQNFGLDEDKDYKLCLEWGGKKQHINLRKLQKKVFIIYKRFEMTQEFEVYGDSNNRDLYQQLPDVVVSISSDDKHYVFYRIKCQDFLLSRSQYKDSMVLHLKTDNSVCKLEQHQAGQISLRCAISQAEDFSSLTEQQWPTLKVRPHFEEVRIICCYYQARKLIASDSSGSSDPSLEFYHLGSSINSTTYPKTLNPSWNEKLVLQSYAIENNLPPMVVNVWDRDITFLGDKKREFMGSSIIQLDKSLIADKEEDLHFINNQKWYEVEFSKNEKAGQVLLGFVVVTKKLFQAVDRMNIMRKITRIPLQKTLHHLKINMLGFRDLQSTGILPVRRVKCEINTSSVKDLLKMQEGAAYTDLVAMSKTSGNNPTIGSVLTLAAQLPTSLTHQPSLSCQVLDQGIAWLGHSSLIGTFEINLSAYSFISKVTLLQKLQVLLKKQKDLLNIHPDSMRLAGNIMILQPLVDKLRRQTKKTESLIKEMDERNYNRSQRNITYDLKITKEEMQNEENQEEEKSGYTGGMNIIEKDEQQYSEDCKIANDEEEDNHKRKKLEDQEELNLNGLMNDGEEGQEEVEQEEEEFKGGMTNFQRLIIEREPPQQEEEEKEGDVQESIIEQKVDNVVKRKVKEEKLEVTLVKEIEQKINLKNIMQDKLKDALNNKKMIVIEPQYKTIKRLGETNLIEENVPNPYEYYQLGFKSKKRDTKHYRLMLDKELEDTEYMGDEEFTTIDIFRGKRLVQKESNFIKRLLFGKEENCRKTGLFRGNVEVIEDEVLQEVSKLNIPDEDRNILELPRNLSEWKYSKRDAEILKSVDVIIRVYVIDAQFEKSLDYTSENDSYVIVKFGDKEIIDKDIEQDQNSPKINKCYEFEATLPGISTISVKFMDEDRLNRDDEIGETKIDLEKRYFDKIWRNYEEKPIEKRKLYLPQYSTSQGWVRCWVDIQQKHQLKKKYDISPRPQTNLELRVVVWEVLDVPNLDFEEVSDLYVNVSLPSLGLSMNTDTHYRAQNGYGSFNWRTVFKLGVDEYTKQEMLRLNFKVYDKDLLSHDDYDSDVTVDIAQLVQDVLQNEQRRKYLGVDENGQTESKRVCLNLVPKEKARGDKETRLIVSIDCLTEEESKQSPAGIGRSDPNQDPYCPEPVGRFQFTLNPIKLLTQLVGPGFRNKMCLIICMILLVAFIIFFGPSLISSLIANMFI